MYRAPELFCHFGVQKYGTTPFPMGSTEQIRQKQE